MEQLFPTGWVHFLLGGVLVGAGTAVVFLGAGIRAGASGFFTTSLSYVLRSAPLRAPRVLAQRSWRTVFTVGLLLGALVHTLVLADGWYRTDVQVWRLALGGVLVGFGTRVSRGCTSGHGICGLAGGARSSFVAVVVFLGVAIATACAVQALGVRP